MHVTPVTLPPTRRPSPSASWSSSRNVKISTVYSPSSKGPDSNLLILFHGLGDMAKNFHAFGVKMELPQTAVLSIQGIFEVPFVGGYSWWNAFTMLGEEIDPNSASVERDLKITRQTLAEYIGRELVDRCGWNWESIFLLGFSDGGTVAVDLVCSSELREKEFGGVVSIAGNLLQHRLNDTSAAVKIKTPLLSMIGDKDERIDSRTFHDNYQRLFSRFFDANSASQCILVKGKNRHCMPQSREEVQALMLFFSKRLIQRHPSLEGNGVYQVKT